MWIVGGVGSFAGFPSGAFRPQWLNALRGYSCDLDWSIDSINEQDGTTLDNIYTRMRENWEYRGYGGEPRTLRYEVFKSNLAQQLKSKRAQMKMRILAGKSKPEAIRLDHWRNMVEITRDPKKIEQANVMREARKCVKKVSTFGRSEGEVRARLVSTFPIAISFFNFQHNNNYENNK